MLLPTTPSTIFDAVWQMTPSSYLCGGYVSDAGRKAEAILFSDLKRPT